MLVTSLLNDGQRLYAVARKYDRQPEPVAKQATQQPFPHGDAAIADNPASRRFLGHTDLKRVLHPEHPSFPKADSYVPPAVCQEQGPIRTVTLTFFKFFPGAVHGLADRRLIFAPQGGQAGIRPAFQQALADQVLLVLVQAGHSLADHFALKQQVANSGSNVK